LRETARIQPLSQSHWLVQLASYPQPGTGEVGSGTIADPQLGWHSLNTTVVEFLKSVPEDQKRTVKGEDLLADLDGGFFPIAAWLGLRTDSEALEAMKHPERSPYARPGPSYAPFGSDMFLLQGPLVRPEWTKPRSLEGPLSWREDGRGFVPDVKELAKQFGYQ
jgi:hypothetical protein